MSKYGPPVRTIGLREQKTWMELIHPSFTCGLEDRAGGKLLICRGCLQPTPISEAYIVRIEYSIGKKPRAWVESPEPRRRLADERIPHTYKDGDICLFRADFTSDLQLARTVLPWLMHWLFFYESWIVTGEWQGGGVHPGNAEAGDLILEESSVHRQRS